MAGKQKQSGRLRFATRSGTALSNYAFDDGSVQTFGEYNWDPDMRQPRAFNIGGLGGIGSDPYAVPAEYAFY